MSAGVYAGIPRCPLVRLVAPLPRISWGEVHTLLRTAAFMLELAVGITAQIR